MESKFSDGIAISSSSLFKCKTCRRDLEDPVKLPCGHRVCNDPCLSQVSISHSEARCPVSSCGAVIALTEVKADLVLRKAITDKVNQMEVKSDTIEKNIDMQSTSIANAQIRTSFQDGVATIKTTLACITEENRNIRDQIKSLKTNMVKTTEKLIKQNQDIEKKLRRQERVISRTTTMLQNIHANVERNTNDIQALQRLPLSSGTRVLSPRNPVN